MNTQNFIKEKLAEYCSANKVATANIDETFAMFLKQEFYKIGIKMSYNIVDNVEEKGECAVAPHPPPTNQKHRFIFTTFRYKKLIGITSIIASECNGLILDGDFNIIHLPLPATNTKIPFAVLIKYIQASYYDVFDIKDGTMLSLYYHDGLWRIGSVNGIDVKDIARCTVKYSDMLFDALKAIGVDQGEFFTTLDRCLTYTFCVKHPLVHPFYEGGKPLHEIQHMASYNRQTHEMTYRLSPTYIDITNNKSAVAAAATATSS
jgi:hypothetical protein